MRDAMRDDAIRVCSMIDSYQNKGSNYAIKFGNRDHSVEDADAFVVSVTFSLSDQTDYRQYIRTFNG